MRWQIALALLPLIATAAHAADIKGTSKIESVTVYPQGAEVTRIGKVKMERGEQVILFNDLPTNAVSRFDPRRGQVHRPARDRLGRHAARQGAEHRRSGGGHRAQAHRGCHREAARRSRATERDGGSRRDAEDADQQPDAAADQVGARQRWRGGAARLGTALRHDRPAHRRGAEDHPRHADQDPRGRPADRATWKASSRRSRRRSRSAPRSRCSSTPAARSMPTSSSATR